MSRPYNLNNPDDARDFLAEWASLGKLTFQGFQTSHELTDDEAISIAKDLFLKSADLVVTTLVQ